MHCFLRIWTRSRVALEPQNPKSLLSSHYTGLTAWFLSSPILRKDNRVCLCSRRNTAEQKVPTQLCPWSLRGGSALSHGPSHLSPQFFPSAPRTSITPPVDKVMPCFQRAWFLQAHLRFAQIRSQMSSKVNKNAIQPITHNQSSNPLTPAEFYIFVCCWCDFSTTFLVADWGLSSFWFCTNEQLLTAFVIYTAVNKCFQKIPL